MNEYTKSERIIDTICLILFPMGFVALAVLARMGYSEANYADTYVFVTEVISTVIVTVLPALRLTRSFRCPYWFMLIVTSVVYVHSVALFTGFYQSVSWWDIFSHSYSSIVVTMIVFTALLVIDHYTTEINLGTSTLLLMTFVIGYAFGNFWEIGEWFIDNTFGMTLMSYSVEDTLRDLLSDALGAVVMTSIAAFIVFCKNPDRIVGEMNLDYIMVRIGNKWDRRCRPPVQ
jgi:hypothetical protein